MNSNGDRGGLKIIKAFTGEKFVKERFAKTNEEFYNQSVKVYRKTDLTSPISETVVVGILMLILFIGGNESLPFNFIVVCFNVVFNCWNRKSINIV